MSPRASSTALDDYEKLVLRTAQLLHAQLHMEMEDLRQELRIKVWKTLGEYDPMRSELSERKFVYGCVMNYVKDLKKEVARRAEPPKPGQRRCAWEPPVAYIEDRAAESSLNAFESRYQNTGHEQVYGAIEETLLTLPPTITEPEAKILVLMMLGFTQVEVARKCGVSYELVKRRVESLRQKLADLRAGVEGRAARSDRSPIAA